MRGARTQASGVGVLAEGKGSVSKFVHKLYDERAQRIIIGFTGRTGSGCSTAAKILTKPSAYLRVAVDHAPTDVLDRKDRIVARFATENWRPFSLISVTAMIASYTLEHSGQDFIEFARVRNLIGASDSRISDEAATRVAEKIDTVRKQCAGEIARTTTLTMPPQGKQEAHSDYFLVALPKFLSEVRVELGNVYVQLFQILGDNCRRFGNAYSGVEAES